MPIFIGVCEKAGRRLLSGWLYSGQLDRCNPVKLNEKNNVNKVES